MDTIVHFDDLETTMNHDLNSMELSDAVVHYCNDDDSEIQSDSPSKIPSISNFVTILRGNFEEKKIHRIHFFHSIQRLASVSTRRVQ